MSCTTTKKKEKNIRTYDGVLYNSPNKPRNNCYYRTLLGTDRLSLRYWGYAFSPIWIGFQEKQNLALFKA